MVSVLNHAMKPLSIFWGTKPGRSILEGSTGYGGFFSLLRKKLCPKKGSQWIFFVEGVRSNMAFCMERPPGPNEKNLIGMMFDRETKREKSLEQIKKQGGGAKKDR